MRVAGAAAVAHTLEAPQVGGQSVASFAANAGIRLTKATESTAVGAQVLDTLVLLDGEAG